MVNMTNYAQSYTPIIIGNYEVSLDLFWHKKTQQNLALNEGYILTTTLSEPPEAR